ncbi:hypothetical protein Y919_01435 [Caloranaerobacter azorensis H53214]|uniref:YidE/YbjL duplication domain-containing protein n=1 Tax=Caloranaerobacter azorensis H53214 TaxID=1156417 RepID=A0A096DPY2_9FIRM|nr:hypothetical protein [Caloranaerobacter azorensis]KGG81311.1 hypothetical protein Y919_01435 [Caloranaerobacter azorensis H53214]
MNLDVAKFITNPFVLMFASVFLGQLLGRINFGRFKLGSSGGLFTGLIIGWVIYKNYALPYKGLEQMPAYAKTILKQGVISRDFFLFTLILFVAAVGLLASKDLDKVLKKYGVKFIILGIIITFTGAFVTYIMTLISKGQNLFAISGVYTGALTSSPGLAAALESVSIYGKEAESMVGFGYAIGYIPGVLIVILAMQFMPLIFGIDINKEKEEFFKEMYSSKENNVKYEEVQFDLIAFVFVCLFGIFIGKLKIYLGPTINYFSLGTTGGVLISSLLLGYIGRIGFLNFRMNSKVLGVIRELALSFFLTIVGLRYGYSALTSLTGSGLYLALVALICGFSSIFVGFIIGRYVFKINWIVLAGALCGGMTSTPGLGAAIDATDCDDVAAGYGATYPFALLGMIVFTIMLYKLPI